MYYILMLLLVICLLLYSENLKLSAELKKCKKVSKSYKNTSIKYVLIIKKGSIRSLFFEF